MQSRVLVLVSTYNGERFLRQQLDSIIGQQGVDVSVLVRDDGSSDSTIQILDEYAIKYPNFQYYQGTNAGPCMSFFDLLKHAEGYDYYAFSDQDDVWDEDKLIRAVSFIRQKPLTHPVLYCSNLKIVDENLAFCRNAQSSFNPQLKYSALVDFYAVGCTEVFNQAAADLTKEHIRTDCIMHDSWIFMICIFWGNVIYDRDSRINYRQHSNNVVGTKKDKLSIWKARFKRVTNRTVQPRYRNAQLLVEEFKNMLPDSDFKKIKKVASYKNGFINQLRLLFDFKIRSNSIASDLRYRFLILLREI